MRLLKSFIAFAALAAAAVPLRAAEPKVLIRNVNIVTLDDRGTIAGGSVLVDGKTIAAVLPAGAAPPKAARVIDGKGGWLIPGLIDAHVHFEATNELASMLRYGVTSVFALGAQSDEQVPEIVKAMRDQAAGRIVGAHLYSTGPSVPVHHEIKSVADVPVFMDGLQRDGFGYIKLYNEVPKDIFDAIVAEARRRHMGVFGHLPRRFPAQYSLSHGLNVVAHMEEFFFAPFNKDVTDSALPDLSPDWAPDMALADSLLDTAKANDVAIIPNLVASRNFRDLWVDEDEAFALPDAGYMDAEVIRDWRKYNYSHRNLPALRQVREEIKYPYIRTMTYRAQQKGILLLAGTDSPLPALYPGRSLQQELRLLVAAGLSNVEALRAATINGGIVAKKHVDPDGCIGSITAGCQADLVLLASDPTEDIRNAADIVGVMADGAYYRPADLERWRTPPSSRPPAKRKR